MVVQHSLSPLPFFADAAAPRPRARQARGWEFPRMAVPQESPVPPPAAPSGRELRTRCIAADLLSRG